MAVNLAPNANRVKGPNEFGRCNTHQIQTRHRGLATGIPPTHFPHLDGISRRPQPQGADAPTRRKQTGLLQPEFEAKTGTLITSREGEKK